MLSVDASMTEHRSPLTTSVVIPVRNGGELLLAQLEALSKQVDAQPFEVIIADNGSTDGTADAVRSFSAPYPLTLVDASRRSGASCARNVGAAAASGELLLFCDADDDVETDWVQSLQAAYLASDGAVVAGSLDLSRNPVDVLHAYGEPTPTEDGETEKMLLDEAAAFAGLLPTVCSANFAVARDLYLAVGGMDESYRGGCEETDFTWRAVLAGARVVASPRAQVHYRLRNSPRAIFRQQRNYQRERILLWTRFRDAGMSGPSVRFSVLELLTTLATFPKWVGDPARRMAAMRLAGGNWGALEGVAMYRFAGRVPQRSLMDSPATR